MKCGIEAGVHDLRGTAAIYYPKQLAQAVVPQLSAVREIKNSIRVVGATMD